MQETGIRSFLNLTRRPLDFGDDGTLRGRVMNCFWSVIWLVWLAEPFLAGVHRHQYIGAAAIVVFAAVYVWHFLARVWVYSDVAESKISAAARSMPVSLGRYAAMAILAVVAMVTIGQEGAACLVYIGIAAMWTFPISVAFAASFLTASTYVVLWHQVSDWHPDYGSLVGMCFGTIAVLAGRTSAERKRALDASRVENAQLAVQAERNRMARDLHDILGHSLTVITVKAELAGRLLDAGADEKARTEVADLERLSREALADVRRAVEGYREISLSGELARAREALKSAGIAAQLPTATDDVAGDARELFAWVVREGVTNVVRHSNASHCRIEVGRTGCVIADDGPAASIGHSGNGLRGLRERAVAAGFEVLTDASANGFVLSVRERETSGGRFAVLTARRPER